MLRRLQFIILITLMLGAFSERVEASSAMGSPDSLSWLRRTIRGFSKIDTTYIEPQHYEFSAMLQMTHAYDVYQLKSSSGQAITFAPSPTVKFGPYFGWRWAFAGYTFDLKNVSIGRKAPKQEIDLSFYASQVGVDLFYRRTGSDYKIRNVHLSPDTNEDILEDREFDGLSVGITGFNLYYIFNHQRFSYPAAFAQSTRQKRSVGSWMAGLGYTRNSLEFDYQKLQHMIAAYSITPAAQLDSGLMFNSVKYYDYCLSGGYAYNWVFRKNWLLGASLSIGLGYKHTIGDVQSERRFRLNNFSFDGIARLGLVYNDNTWYAGASAIFHGYTYRKSRFSSNNAFGSLNIYVGYNFLLKKKYRNKQ